MKRTQLIKLKNGYLVESVEELPPLFNAHEVFLDIESRKPPSKSIINDRIYNEWDAFVGYWVQDRPYIYVSKNSYKTSERLYLSRNKYVDTNIDSWLSNYFGSIMII